MATQQLNTFKTVTANLTTADTMFYTTPTRKSAIFLAVNASNITEANLATVNFYHGNASNVKTAIVKNFKIPAGDAMSIISAGSKLVLESGQKIFASASANNSVQLVMSVLESVN
jgi:hypothetical protein